MRSRIVWIDCLKGASIVLVVLFHTQYVVESTPWVIDMINEKMGPIRMPAFFLASGMLTSFILQSDWHMYLRRRVVPLIYTFVVWSLAFFTFSQVLLWPEPIAVEALPAMFLEPKYGLWFVAELALFTLAVRLFARYPAATLAAAALYAGLFWFHKTGSRIGNETRYFVFFATGAFCQPLVRRLLEARPFVVALVTAALWLTITLSPLPNRGFVMSAIGVAGFASVLILVSRTALARPLSYVGAHSVSIYLMHWLAMANVAALSPWPIGELPGVLALTSIGVIVPVLVRPLLPDVFFMPPRHPLLTTVR